MMMGWFSRSGVVKWNILSVLSLTKSADLYMPDAQGKMVKSDRKSRAPGITR